MSNLNSLKKELQQQYAFLSVYEKIKTEEKKGNPNIQRIENKIKELKSKITEIEYRKSHQSEPIHESDFTKEDEMRILMR